MLISVQTNQDGKAQYAVAFRNKRVDQCPVGALTLYLFFRYHIAMEPWPPFHDRKEWYKTKLLVIRGRPTESLQAQSHRDTCNNAYDKAGATMLRGTHKADVRGAN
jgi:hypothetical protein